MVRAQLTSTSLLFHLQHLTSSAAFVPVVSFSVLQKVPEEFANELSSA